MNLWPFKRRREVTIQILPREATDLRLNEWQADAKLCGASRQHLQSDLSRLMLQVLHNSSPAFWFLDKEAGLDVRALHQARIEGYNLAIANLLALGEHKAPARPLTETFGTDEKLDRLEQD